MTAFIFQVRQQLSDVTKRAQGVAENGQAEAEECQVRVRRKRHPAPHLAVLDRFYSTMAVSQNEAMQTEVVFQKMVCWLRYETVCTLLLSFIKSQCYYVSNLVVFCLKYLTIYYFWFLRIISPVPKAIFTYHVHLFLPIQCCQ